MVIGTDEYSYAEFLTWIFCGHILYQKNCPFAKSSSLHIVNGFIYLDIQSNIHPRITFLFNIKSIQTQDLMLQTANAPKTKTLNVETEIAKWYPFMFLWLLQIMTGFKYVFTQTNCEKIRTIRLIIKLYRVISLKAA